MHIAQCVHTQMERRHQQKIADYCGITLNLIWHDAITVRFCHLSKIIAHTYYVLLYALSSITVSGDTIEHPFNDNLICRVDFAILKRLGNQRENCLARLIFHSQSEEAG